MSSYAEKQRKQGNATRFECPRPVWVGRRPSTGPASCNDMLLAGSRACKSKASCGQVLAGKKASARIWSKTVRFLCCHIKNFSAGWPPSCCQVLAAWQKQGKARKAKPGHPGKVTGGQDAPVTGPGCTGKARQGKAKPGYPGKKRGPGKRPGSPGKATGDGQEALAKGLCTTQRAKKPRPSHPGGAPEAPAKPPRGGPGTTGKNSRGGKEPPAKVAGFRVCTFVIATSVRVITCRVKQLWRPRVSA